MKLKVTTMTRSFALAAPCNHQPHG